MKPNSSRPPSSSEDQIVQSSWIIENELAVGPRPGSALQRLKELGFKHDIDLNADPEEADDALRVECNYHPLEVRDTDSIQTWLAKMDLAIRIIDQAHDNMEPVYIHCTYGKGRSPTFAMAYLIFKGRSIQEAQQIVTAKHPDTWSPGNPTSKYTEILEAYARLIRKRLKSSE